MKIVTLLSVVILLLGLYTYGALPWKISNFDLEPVGSLKPLGKADILLFSKTNGFRHSSIKPALLAIGTLARRRGWTFLSTENGAYFNSRDLTRVKVVVFLSTTGNILTPEQKLAFENYVDSGGGYAGIHSASDTEHGWTWYDQLLGTHFESHTLLPKHIAAAELINEGADHPASRNLPARWFREDEWYNFKRNVRGLKNVSVLLTINESSYRSIWPRRMGGDHPISWTNLSGSGRMFYTAIGHTPETFSDSLALAHIIGGIAWAGCLQ